MEESIVLLFTLENTSQNKRDTAFSHQSHQLQFKETQVSQGQNAFFTHISRFVQLICTNPKELLPLRYLIDIGNRFFIVSLSKQQDLGELSNWGTGICSSTPFSMLLRMNQIMQLRLEALLQHMLIIIITCCVHDRPHLVRRYLLPTVVRVQSVDFLLYIRSEEKISSV